MPCSNQHIAPALWPAISTSASRHSRITSSRPCARQIASRLTMLPPPTKIASLPSSSSRSSTGFSPSRNSEITWGSPPRSETARRKRVI